MLTRRRFLQLGLFGSAAVSAAAVASPSALEITTLKIELNKIRLSFENLPKEFNGYRIGFIGDIHLGPYVPDSLLEEAVSLLQNANIDLLLLGGDYINLPHSVISALFGVVRNEAFGNPADETLGKRVFERFCEVLSDLKPADGILAVYGNHDRWVAKNACVKAFALNGIELLVNEWVVIERGRERIKIVGFDEYWTGIPRASILSGLEESDFRILLAHNPDFISELIEKTDYGFDLALAGHTHGGQIKLPFVGAPVQNVQDLRFREGLYRHPRGLVYTTRGVGVVEIPHRINCPPEVTVLELNRSA